MLRERNSAGTYTVASVWLTDGAGNVAKYDTEQLKALGFNTTLAVTGRPADLAPPVLTKLTLPKSVDLSGGTASIPVSAEAMDNAGGSGLASVLVWFDQPLYTDGYRTENLYIGSSTWGVSVQDGIPERLSRPVSLESTTAPGTYQVRYVTVTDLAGNSRDVHLDELKAIGASTSMTVSGGMLDTTPPELIDMWLPRAVSLRSGAQNAFAVTARDAAGGGGVASVVATFDRQFATSEGTRSTLYIGSLAQDSFTDATPGFAVDQFRLTDATAPGTYNLVSVQVGDKGGNYTVYTAAELQQRGINTTMLVADRAATASATPSLVNGNLVISMSSPDWGGGGKDSFAATFAYDAAT
ncbi:MAG: hypothetical protein ACREEO_08395, partial [Phenylobacterium sp.]